MCILSIQFDETGVNMDTLILYKLIILYMLDRVNDYPLTNSQITSFLQDHGYTGLFNIHESLSELIDKGFITVNTVRDIQHYTITDSGEEALYYFENRISKSIKQEILEFFEQEKIKLKNENETYADYYGNESGDYTVECYIKDRRETLVDLKMTVPTKNLALSICDKWPEKSKAFYEYMISELWN